MSFRIQLRNSCHYIARGFSSSSLVGRREVRCRTGQCMGMLCISILLRFRCVCVRVWAYGTCICTVCTVPISITAVESIRARNCEMKQRRTVQKSMKSIDFLLLRFRQNVRLRIEGSTRKHYLIGIHHQPHT